MLQIARLTTPTRMINGHVNHYYYYCAEAEGINRYWFHSTSALELIRITFNFASESYCDQLDRKQTFRVYKGAHKLSLDMRTYYLFSFQLSIWTWYDF